MEDPSRWRLIEEILISSWELPQGERETYWTARAAGDESMLRQPRDLSAAGSATDGWRAQEPLASRTHRVGPYVLDRLIGRGGIGAVYLAHHADGEFDQQVAVKVIGLLFQDVCAGVQYAHQHLVVYPDIKPSNVLVNRQGFGKLLDFGAAKLLAEAGMQGTSRLPMMTVAYASPECGSADSRVIERTAAPFGRSCSA